MANPFVRVATIQANSSIVDGEGKPSPAFLRSLNDAFGNLAGAINTLAQIPGIQEALLELDAATIAAQTAADNAQAAADNAAAAGDQTAQSSALANSYPSGVTLDAVDTGTEAEITISAHDRVYATNPITTVAVSGGVLTGLAYDTRYFIYYDQPSRAGGGVTYQATTIATDVAQINDRHSVGTVLTPISGAPSNPGSPVSPPGGQYEVRPD